MTQSDALPLQWYPEGVKTFNEQRNPGVEHKCYYQPWRCDVDVIDQFYDGSLRDYVLRALDSQGVQLFEKTYEAASYNLLQDLQDWVVIPSPSANWSGIGTPTPSVTFPDFQADSDYIKCNAAPVAGRTYRIVYTFTSAVAASTANFAFRAAGVFIGPSMPQISVPVGTTTGYFDLTVDVDADECTLIVGCNLGDESTITVISVKLYEITRVNTNTIYSVAFNPASEGICKKLVKFELWDVTEDDEAPEPIRISRTDLMEFKQSDSITMFEYTAKQNYDGLTYLLPDLTAEPLFRLCVDGVFVHEREVTEEVVIELTDATIGTATSLGLQKLLTVQDAPDYFHRKVQLMLAHGFIGSVTDDRYNRTWLRAEKYDKVLRDRRYILKEGNVQLTEINYLKRAVI